MNSNKTSHRWTGGAWLDYFSATWPLATLELKKNYLSLDVAFQRKFEFTPKQVKVIRRYGFITILAQGIKIEHLVSGRSKTVIFWYMGLDLKKLLKPIKNNGFKVQGI